ncbi:FtsX-like permease family protein [Mangrovibacillus cuniculi]|uniref:ABC transporter permease n=1 Tax=Mangrovibacillus cuniculi TaxID=2593652 RepID=A0A7S8CBP1_9BACI|nr:ABC transporter permease [Mangrovibacillus cuniculi]QPC46843.1 ABC transporter permease [Mangrovibacillus cuniculi]
MFFNFVKRNSNHARKENGVYFSSLIISIIAFYVILSLEEQDVMIYLKTIESDAVGRLLLLIPVLYGVSLFFVFFLVYFANKYQIELRRHEFGLYQMLGMKRRKLFLMLMGETFWNGLIALLIGIPISLFITEMISLGTSRVIGMGIIGHEFRISWKGLFLTIMGFISVQMMAVAIHCIKISKKEPLDLLRIQKEDKQKILSPVKSMVSLASGIALTFGAIFLCIAYGLSILYLREFDYKIFALILILGIIGTCSLFKGLGSFIGMWIKRKSSTSKGLFVFTGRQLQENVVSQWTSLSIASLLLLMSMVCLTYGLTTVFSSNHTLNRTADFTFRGSENVIVDALNTKEINPYVEQFYPMRIASTYSSDSENPDSTVSWSGLMNSIRKESDSDQKDVLLNNFNFHDTPYIISLSSYNDLLRTIKMPEIKLKDKEIAMYSDEDWSYAHPLLSKVLMTNPTIHLNENEYILQSKLYTKNVVADRAITLSYALIVPDEVFDSVVDHSYETTLFNMVLTSKLVDEKGLMQSMHQAEKLLDATNLEYDSYLSSMGRNLFYTVAGSYTTTYLGLMFLIIANTVLGIEFLMHQKSTNHRYYTLTKLGASVKSMCVSARIQIWLFFGLVIIVALCSSIFGVWSMLESFPKRINVQNDTSLIIVFILLFLAIEIMYIWIIQRKSDKEIKKLIDMK